VHELRKPKITKMAVTSTKSVPKLENTGIYLSQSAMGTLDLTTLPKGFSQSTAIEIKT